MRQYWKSDYTQFFDIKAIEGKTIDKVYAAGETIGLRFQGGTFIWLNVLPSENDHDALFGVGRVLTTREALSLGLINEFEKDRADAQRRAIQSVEDKADRHRRFLTLKAEFEPET